MSTYRTASRMYGATGFIIMDLTIRRAVIRSVCRIMWCTRAGKRSDKLAMRGHYIQGEPDPAYPELKYMYAPDVVRGNDGRYYLYYCMGGDYGYGGYTGPISVAVCDTPAGKYEYLGHVHYKDGTVMKSTFALIRQP